MIIKCDSLRRFDENAFIVYKFPFGYKAWWGYMPQKWDNFYDSDAFEQVKYYFRLKKLK